MRSRATRRARMSESSSASTATRLAIECRPPENLSSDVSSATRAEGLGSRTAVSSALTSAVSDTGLLAMGVSERGSSLLAAQVAVVDPDLHTRHLRQARGEFVGHDDRAVLSPRAADRDDRVPLVLALIPLEHRH